MASVGATWRDVARAPRAASGCWPRISPDLPQLAQLARAGTRSRGQRADPPLGLEPLVDVAQDQRVEALRRRLEARERGLGRNAAPPAVRAASPPGIHRNDCALRAARRARATSSLSLRARPPAARQRAKSAPISAPPRAPNSFSAAGFTRVIRSSPSSSTMASMRAVDQRRELALARAHLASRRAGAGARPRRARRRSGTAARAAAPPASARCRAPPGGRARGRRRRAAARPCSSPRPRAAGRRSSGKSSRTRSG